MNLLTPRHRGQPDVSPPRSVRRRRAFGWSTPLTLLVCAGVGVAITLIFVLGSGDGGDAQAAVEAEREDWFKVQRRDLDLTVTASGELDSSQRVEVRSLVWGRPEIEWVIDEGTVVEQGDPLFRLNSEEVEKWHQEELLRVSRARADLISAERDLAIEKSNSESSRRQAEVDVQLIELDREKWLNGEVPQTRRDLELKLKKAERDLKRTKRDLELSKELHDEKFISLNELEDAEIAFIQAEDTLATAQLNIQIYEDYTYRRDEQKFESDLDQKRADLERSIERSNSRLERLKADIAAKREALVLREKRLRELDRQLENVAVEAPVPGTVIYKTSVGSAWERRRPIAPGRSVRENETIIYLPNMSRMTAVLKVHEARIQEVAPGMEVDVRIDARPDAPVPARILEVSTTAESDGGRQALRQYRVVAELPAGFDDSLKPGMSCQGTIFTGKVEDTLVIPVQSVYTEGPHHYVYVRAGSGRVKRRLIQIGPASSTLVSVTGGLTEADHVLLRTPRPGEALPEEPFPEVETGSDPTTLPEPPAELEDDTPAGPPGLPKQLAEPTDQPKPTRSKPGNARPNREKPDNRDQPIRADPPKPTAQTPAPPAATPNAITGKPNRVATEPTIQP
ncbi:MAG: HlyD family efflux transporter periplasmic adaptor subunit [Planctomycetota bacterium]